MRRDTLAAFFSYSRDDAQFAVRLAEDLKTAGASIWMDQLDIEPGQRWDRAVEDALAKCSRMVVILSPTSVSSTNVMDEVSFALEEQKTVIPVIYRDCVIPFRLRRVQRIDFRGDYARALQSLVRVLSPTESGATSPDASIQHLPSDTEIRPLERSSEPNQDPDTEVAKPHASALEHQEAEIGSPQPASYPAEDQGPASRQLATGQLIGNPLSATPVIESDAASPDALIQPPRSDPEEKPKVELSAEAIRDAEIHSATLSAPPSEQHNAKVRPKPVWYQSAKSPARLSPAPVVESGATTTDTSIRQVHSDTPKPPFDRPGNTVQHTDTQAANPPAISSEKQDSNARPESLSAQYEEHGPEQHPITARFFIWSTVVALALTLIVGIFVAPSWFKRNSGFALQPSAAGNAPVAEASTLLAHDTSVRDAGFAPDGVRIATLCLSGDTFVYRIWSAAEPRVVTSFSGEYSSPYRGGFSPDALHYLTAGTDGNFRVWNTFKGTLDLFLKGDGPKSAFLTNPAFSPNGTRIVTEGRGTDLQLWNARTGQQIALLKRHPETIAEAFRFTRDSLLVLTANRDGTVQRWNAVDGQPISLGYEIGPIEHAAFSPSGDLIAVTAVKHPNTVQILDSISGRFLQSLVDPDAATEISRVEFLRDNSLVTTNSPQQGLRLWNGRTGQFVTSLRHGDLTSSPQGDLIVTIDDDNDNTLARAWSVDTGKLVTTLKGHRARINSVAFSPDGQRVVTTSEDHTARVWTIR